MHLLSLDTKVVLTKNDSVGPGNFLCDDVNSAHLLVLANGGRMTQYVMTADMELTENGDWNGRHILLIRAGGFGDLVLLTPVLREIKRRWPTCITHVSCMPLYAPVLQGLPFVDHVTNYPVRVEDLDTFDAFVFYEKTVETNPKAKKVHMTDLFADVAGITGNFDKKPEYRISDKEVIWAMEAFPRTDRVQRLCVQVGASARARVYPLELMGRVAEQMMKLGWEVFLLGARGEIAVNDMPGLKNLSAMDLTFRQSSAVLNNADCVLAGDSALLHIAGALGVPAVGLYGPFLGILRTAYCPSTFVIQQHGPCAPCFHHAYLRNDWPENGPCQKTNKCEVLAAIQPERVVQRILAQAKKYELRAM